jgi:leucyl aminopeptidase
MKSRDADINNKGNTRYGGASQAAAFLERFVDKETKWAHLDIAGPAMTKKEGATGFGTQLLLNHICR